jgi:hypothetical protein
MSGTIPVRHAFLQPIFPPDPILEEKRMTTKPDTRGERQKQLEESPSLGEADTPSQGGRQGGDLQRDIASRDEAKRGFERPGGATRVRKKDEKEG